LASGRIAALAAVALIALALKLGLHEPPAPRGEGIGQFFSAGSLAASAASVVALILASMLLRRAGLA